MNLHEINKNLSCLLDQAWEYAEQKDGEYPEGLEDQIQSLEIDREEKIEGLACVIKDLKAEAKALAAEEAKLKARGENKKKQIKRAEAWLRLNLAEGEKFESARAVVSWRKSEFVAGNNLDVLPAECINEKITRAPDKTVINKALKAGVSIEGWRIETRLNMSVK